MSTLAKGQRICADMHFSICKDATRPKRIFAINREFGAIGEHADSRCVRIAGRLSLFCDGSLLRARHRSRKKVFFDVNSAFWYSLCMALDHYQEPGLHRAKLLPSKIEVELVWQGKFGGNRRLLLFKQLYLLGMVNQYVFNEGKNVKKLIFAMSATVLRAIVKCGVQPV